MSARGNWCVALSALLLVLAGCGDPDTSPSSRPSVVPQPPFSPVPNTRDPAIYIARADGSAGVAITHGWAPVRSPDGQRMAFVRPSER